MHVPKLIKTEMSKFEQLEMTIVVHSKSHLKIVC